MAASVTLNVALNDAQAKAGLKAINDAIKPLTKKIAIDVDTAGAVKSLRDLNTIASNLEKQLNKSRGGFGNGVDENIRKAEAASKAFANALKQQMQAEQEVANAHKGLASSYNVIDQAIHANEAAGKSFSNQLKQQMQAEVELERENKKLSTSTTEAGNAASTAANGWSVLGGAMATALGHLASRAIHAALREVTKALREAFTEMKNVDTELTNISKVSGKTGEELAAIGDRAYETASAYGVAASEYLSAVYDMQKAGMGDQAEDMGELAVKTMLVGDTTQDVASKFLLASNAAWKLNGDMGRLSQIVDEADYINNNYATTLDKLAAGMPIVASVAAQAGMSAEETMAALGTITTVTQESGTKAATALRALILNIEGQVGKFVTEEGEEFEVTAESVKSLQGLLEKYAKTEMDAAKAAGELVNPMTAIQALFKGMANEDLNDADLFMLLTSMGGKLRTNQLTALVQNYELFDEMLGRIADSAGTADSEIELMMNSWERKAQVLKNTWTELVADVVDTDLIKGGLDLLTGFVDGVDDVVNRLKDPFYDSKQTQKTYDELKAEYDALVAKGEDLNAVEKIRLADLEKELAILQLQREIEEQAAAKKLQSQLTNNRQDERSLTLYSRESGGIEFAGDITSYQQSLKDLNAEWSDYYKNLISVRDAGIELTDSQQKFIDMYEDNSVAAMADIETVQRTVDGYYALYDAQGKIVAYEKDLSAEQQAQIDFLTERNEYLNSSVDATEDLIKKQEDLQEAQEEYNNAESPEERSAAWDQVLEAQALYEQAIQNATTAESEEASAAGNVADAASGIAPQVDAATSSMNAFTASANNAANAVNGINMGNFGGAGGHALGTKNAPGGPTLVNELGPELISENGRAYIANGGRPGVVNLSKGAIVLTAKETKEALRGGGATKKMKAAVRGAGSTSGVTAPGMVYINGVAVAYTAGSNTNTYITTPTRATATFDVGKSSSGSKKRSGGGSGGGGGGSSKSKKGKSLKQQQDELDDLLSNLEKQAKLADNRGEYQKEAELFGKANDAVQKMVEAYRKKGYKDTSDEILDLLNKGYDYQNKQEKAAAKPIEELASELKDTLSNLDKQAKLAQELGDYAKEAGIYGQAQSQIDAMVEAYKEAGFAEDSDEILDLLSKNNAYTEKQTTALERPLKELATDIKSVISNLDKQAALAEDRGDYLTQVKFYEQAQESIKELVDAYREAGFAEDSDEILDLLSQNYEYANKQLGIYQNAWDDLIDSLDAETNAQELANRLAEKQQALDDAREALANAQRQRTIRMYNAATGQWEWVADEKKISSAQKSLDTAQEAYAEEVKSQAVAELESLRDAVTDLNDVVLGPALSAVALMAENSAEFQNFARALNAVYGVGSYLGSTEGSSKVISTANDSHDTIYSFGNVTLTEEQASNMSVAQLAQKLQVLKIS